MNIRYLLLILPLLPCLALAQPGDPRVAPAKLPLERVDRLLLPPLDNEALQQAERERWRPGVAPRFAEAVAVEVTPFTHGNWEQLSLSEAVWRLRILSPGAYSLNLGFTEYDLPAGAELVLYSPDGRHILGPFRPADNEAHDQLWTPILEGDELVVQLRLPLDRARELRLRLGVVNHDFLGFSRLLSGNCHLDVACGGADGWDLIDRYRDLIQSVAVYGLGGDTFCSGFLINNGREDCTPYFLTANHCGLTTDNAPSVVVYWNFRNSTCRRPGSSENGGRGDGSLADYNLGAALRAAYGPSDFALLELDDPVPDRADAFFAGWTTQAGPPADTLVCIHHPGSDEKRISFSFSDTYPGLWGRGTERVDDGNHLVVRRWSLGTTESGSSGAPLFDRFRRAVGQLHGGLASCDNAAGFDQFGWLRASFTGGGEPENSLRPWLDPDGLGLTALPGKRQRECRFLLKPDAAVREICGAGSVDYALAVSPEFAGPVALRLLNPPAGFTARWAANPVSPGGTATLTVTPDGTVGPGEYQIQVEGDDGTTTIRARLTLIISAGRPAPPQLLFPADGEAEVNPTAELRWSAGEPGGRYRIQVAADAAFNQILFDRDNHPAPTVKPDSLAAGARFFWRVQAVNGCGAGDWSAAAAFSTANIECDRWIALDLPKALPPSGRPKVESVIEVTTPGSVLSARVVDLDLSHSFVGDVRVSLIAPSGRQVILFDRLGYPDSFFGCDGDDLRLSFDDTAEATALQLEDACDRHQAPAASGLYRPLEPLSALRDQPAQGLWKLLVEDFSNDDGGTFNQWRLELCVALAKNTSLTSASNHYDACPGQPLAFDVTLGTGFNARGVTLALPDLPAGLSASFSANPAPPGATVTVRLEGFTAAAAFPLTLQASDGADSTALPLTIRSIGPPAAPTLSEPVDGADHVGRQTLLRWHDAPGATAYRLLVSERPDLSQPLTSREVADTFFLLTGLRSLRTYYWQVAALNQCPAETPSAVYSFTTGGDLSVFSSTAALTACPGDEPSFQLSIGDGFDGARLRLVAEPAAPLRLTADADTNALPGGAVITCRLLGLDRAAPGDYDLLLTVEDSQNRAELNIALRLNPAPAIPVLLLPATGEEIESPLPQWSWQPAPEADSYLLEVATDEQFAAPLFSLSTADTTLAAAESLLPGHYYWRVTARNGCGNATSAARHFSLKSTAVGQVRSENLRLFPNPATGRVFLTWKGVHPRGPWQLEWLSSDGRLLQRRNLPAQYRHEIDLSTLPAGVCLLRLNYSGGVLVRRVVKMGD